MNYKHVMIFNSSFKCKILIKIYFTIRNLLRKGYLSLLMPSGNKRYTYLNKPAALFKYV